MNPKAEASAIKIKNIIDVAITFSAMNRVFEKGSKQKITEKLERSFGLLAGVNSKDDFEKIHAEFCEWFIKTVYTSKKGLKKAASYGQAAIVFSIALKVYVYYCNLPDPETAARLLPWLHAAVDTVMMKTLKTKYPHEISRPQSSRLSGSLIMWLYGNWLRNTSKTSFRTEFYRWSMRKLCGIG